MARDIFENLEPITDTWLAEVGVPERLQTLLPKNRPNVLRICLNDLLKHARDPETRWKGWYEDTKVKHKPVAHVRTPTLEIPGQPGNPRLSQLHFLLPSLDIPRAVVVLEKLGTELDDPDAIYKGQLVSWDVNAATRPLIQMDFDGSGREVPVKGLGWTRGAYLDATRTILAAHAEFTPVN